MDLSERIFDEVMVECEGFAFYLDWRINIP